MGKHLLVALVVLAGACSSEAPASDGSSPGRSAEVEQAAAGAALVARRGRELRRLLAGAAPAAPGLIPRGFVLPERGDGYLTARSGDLAVSARPSLELAGDGDSSVFERGFSAGDSAWMLSRSPRGIEDFVRVGAPGATPGRSAVDYELRLNGVAGLRLVSNVLEFLDAQGAPRLRMRAPLAVDALGRAWPVQVAVNDCRADISLAPPWGRPVTPPGSDTCEVELSFDAAAEFPVWVDPEWHTTSELAVARTQMARQVGAGPALAIGGLDAAGQPLASVERFDEATLTWAMTGALASPRVGGDLLLDSASVWMLVGGGTAQTERYDAVSGTWSAGPASQWSHECAVRTGGTSGLVLQIGPANGVMEVEYLARDGSAWSRVDAGAPPPARSRASCSIVQGGHVFLVGGVDSGGIPQLSTWSLDLTGASEVDGELQGAVWTQGPSIDVAFPQGVNEPLFVQNLVVAGEIDGAPSVRSLVLKRVATTWQAQRGPDLPLAVSHAATATDEDNQVWLLGGQLADGSDSDQAFSLFAANPVGGWQAQPTLLSKRRDAHLAVLGNGNFLLAGGEGDGSALVTSELYGSAPVDCVTDAQCLGGACVDGRCCETACDGICQACIEARTGRPDGECAPVLAGLDSDGDCLADTSNVCGLDGTCDGSGQCHFPRYDTRCGGECSGESAVRADHCDGNGQCVEGPVESCQGLPCEDGACRSRCLDSRDCLEGYRCTYAGSCEREVPEPPVCDCAPYDCNLEGVCLTSCSVDTDCVGLGVYCSEEHRCEALEFLPADFRLADACLCSLPGAARRSSGSALLLLLPALFWLRRRSTD
ncbi:MAG: hypothetical protein R3B89_06300 [Polyangiaceae bacterium]